MIVQVFKYEVIQVFPIEELKLFKDHRRLSVFLEKGCKCVKCGLEGTQLIKGKARNGNIHWDIYTEDLFPLTVDHIIPKSKGGSDNMENKQPMCARCNNKKGNKIL